MADLERVRWVAGDESETAEIPVWQGYFRGEHNMAGAVVYVTQDTLRRVMDEAHAQVAGDTFFIENNPFYEDELLAFGGKTPEASAILAPDGVTPLYAILDWSVVIIQKWDPNAGSTYRSYHDNGEHVDDGRDGHHDAGSRYDLKPWGDWANIETTFGKPSPRGFVIGPHDVAIVQGMGGCTSDDPNDHQGKTCPIHEAPEAETVAERVQAAAARADDGPDPEHTSYVSPNEAYNDPPPHVQGVVITLSDGSTVALGPDGSVAISDAPPPGGFKHEPGCTVPEHTGWPCFREAQAQAWLAEQHARNAATV